jgi:hypothetical protein
MFDNLVVNYNLLVETTDNRFVLPETVLVTSANSGIGLALAKQYGELGWSVIAPHLRDSTPDPLARYPTHTRTPGWRHWMLPLVAVSISLR